MNSTLAVEIMTNAARRSGANVVIKPNSFSGADLISADKHVHRIAVDDEQINLYHFTQHWALIAHASFSNVEMAQLMLDAHFSAVLR